MERSLGVQGWALPGYGLTFWPLDAGVLVVAEEEALPAVAFIAAHHVDAALLTATIALGTLVHICVGWVVGEAMGCRPGSGVCPETSAHPPHPNAAPSLRPESSHSLITNVPLLLKRPP